MNLCKTFLLLFSSLPLLAAPASRAHPAPPPDSPEALRHFLQNALAVARSGNAHRLAALVKGMQIPNYEAWFTSTFGPDLGASYAATYGNRLSENDLFRQRVLLSVAHLKIEGIPIRRVNDAPNPASRFEPGMVRGLQRPVAVFYVTEPLAYFVFIDGKFRWWSSFIPDDVSVRIDGHRADVDRRTAVFEGTIVNSSCGHDGSLDLTISTAGGEVRLHAPEAKSIPYAPDGWQPPANFDPCTDLRGKRAKIFTIDVKSVSNFPEIVSIELKPKYH